MEILAELFEEGEVLGWRNFKKVEFWVEQCSEGGGFGRAMQRRWSFGQSYL